MSTLDTSKIAAEQIIKSLEAAMLTENRQDLETFLGVPVTLKDSDSRQDTYEFPKTAWNNGGTIGCSPGKTKYSTFYADFTGFNLPISAIESAFGTDFIEPREGNRQYDKGEIRYDFVTDQSGAMVTACAAIKFG